MPHRSSPAHRSVCVTGASGFIGAHVARAALARGHRVRGTVRRLDDPARYGFITAPAPWTEDGRDGQEPDRFELFEADLLVAGSFDAAIAGCDTVVHVASPYVLNVADPRRELLEPAVNGTLEVLRSAREAAVRRVVLTSSMAAVSDEPIEGATVDEDDWNERSTLERNPYHYSKVQAERAAWSFVRTEATGLDLVVVNPYMVAGPSLGPRLNTTNAVFRDMLTGAYPGILALAWGIVDVRDVAEAHVLAMETPSASGRYLCAGETLTMREIVGLLRSAGYGERYSLPALDLTCGPCTAAVKLAAALRPRGTRSYLRTHLGRIMRCDDGKIRRELGATFRPARATVLAAVADLERHGHLPA